MSTETEAPPELKPIDKMSRKALEKEAKEITDVELSKEPKKLHDSGLRAAVRLNRRRHGITPE